MNIIKNQTKASETKKQNKPQSQVPREHLSGTVHHQSLLSNRQKPLTNWLRSHSFLADFAMGNEYP